MMWLNRKVVIINVMLQFLDIHRLEREREIKINTYLKIKIEIKKKIRF